MMWVLESLILYYEIPSASASLNAIESAFESKSSKVSLSTSVGERAITSSSSSASAMSSVSAGHSNELSINTIFFFLQFSLFLQEKFKFLKVSLEHFRLAKYLFDLGVLLSI